MGISATATYYDFCKQDIEKKTGELVEINPSKLFVASIEDPNEPLNQEEIDTHNKEEARVYDRFLDPLSDKYKVDIKIPFLFESRHAGVRDISLTYDGKTVNEVNIIFSPGFGNIDKGRTDDEYWFELEKRTLANFNSLGLSQAAISDIRNFFEWVYDEIAGRELDIAVAQGYIEKDSAEQIKNAKAQGKTITKRNLFLLEVDPEDTKKVTSSKLKKYWAIS